MQHLGLICTILLIIGGLNWLLIGLADINLVTALFGVGMLANIVYIIVGIAAIIKLVDLIRSRA